LYKIFSPSPHIIEVLFQKNVVILENSYDYGIETRYDKNEKCMALFNVG